ncbi:MAG: 8-oxo-dGTP diphosphatase MutT [Legionella sp.]|nr:8-oxo-dGTP diphosphatase MutT [Legionella sp.]
MKVAVAIITDAHGRILLTQRPLHAAHGGQWEFPGGKLEDEEEALAALKREVKEEVGLQVLDAEFLATIEHTYGIKKVTLLVYCVDKFQGTPLCLESQIDLRWVDLEELSDYEFPEANEKIIQLLKLKKLRALSQSGSFCAKDLLNPGDVSLGST